MEFLSMTRDAFQAHINSTNSSRIDKLTVGAAILRRGTASQHILLPKRNANESYYPNVFEMPGEKVDANNASIRDAIIREVAQETKLAVASIRSPLSPITCTTEKKAMDSSGKESIIQRYTMQLSYIVAVEGDGADFIVNKDEHSTGVWADRKALDEIPITKDMRRLVLEALDRVEALDV